MANSKKIEGICPYCGEKTILTRDHVIPQCLYANGVPANSPKIYACSMCNNILKSRLDVYIRDFLITDCESRKVVPTRFGTSLVKSYPYCLHEDAMIFFIDV
jgi:hypothetical protein